MYFIEQGVSALVHPATIYFIKQGVSALVHPATMYFIEQVVSTLVHSATYVLYGTGCLSFSVQGLGITVKKVWSQSNC